MKGAYNMKLNIGSYGVNVSVKNNICGKRATMLDTIYFLNELSTIYNMAAEQYESKGYEALAEDAAKKSNEIYELLKKMGAYKD
jgi:hypothetical protein